MANRSKLIAGLRKLTREPSVEEDTEALGRELRGDSDRAVIILTASYLEDAAKAAILHKMRVLENEEYQSIFGPNAPAGSFSAKINLAYALKIFGPETKNDMHMIRELRNSCAHSKRPVSFATEQVVRAAISLRNVQGVELSGDDEDPKRLRLAFIDQCNILIILLTQADKLEHDEATRAERLP